MAQKIWQTDGFEAQFSKGSSSTKRRSQKEEKKMMEWLMQGQNLAVVLAVVMLADKIVKLTPTKYDDAIVDMIKGIIGRMKKDWGWMSLMVIWDCHARARREKRRL